MNLVQLLLGVPCLLRKTVVVLLDPPVNHPHPPQVSKRVVGERRRAVGLVALPTDHIGAGARGLPNDRRADAGASVENGLCARLHELGELAHLDVHLVLTIVELAGGQLGLSVTGGKLGVVVVTRRLVRLPDASRFGELHRPRHETTVHETLVLGGQEGPAAERLKHGLAIALAQPLLLRGCRAVGVGVGVGRSSRACVHIRVRFERVHVHVRGLGHHWYRWNEIGRARAAKRDRGGLGAVLFIELQHPRAVDEGGLSTVLDEGVAVFQMNS
mmetsp:Transcript_5226/g.8887  ORF Transcript_5226/g.8887 Transcript_5226/m.8887 type:complete len:272 (-) Transcript_5226:261-1076(-)